MRAVVIGIDASRAFSAVSTGTERYSHEVIGALLRLAPQHEYRLYVRVGDLTPQREPGRGGEGEIGSRGVARSTGPARSTELGKPGIESPPLPLSPSPCRGEVVRLGP